MVIWEWITRLFNKDTRSLRLDATLGELATEMYFKELAVQACVNLIANTVARSEFRTYEKGVEVRKENHYLFNVEPNRNKSASKFWRDVVHHLVYDNECLVVQYDGKFYVADTFSVDRYAFRDYVYSGVIIDGFALDRKYLESDVLHFELHNDKVKDLIDGLYHSYAKLIAASQAHYKGNATRRGALTVPVAYPQTDMAQGELRELLEKRFKQFFSAEGDAVIPLTNGMTYSEDFGSKTSGSKGSLEGRDIRSFIDDVFDFTAIGFQVPPQLLKGNVADTDKAVGNFLTFCINPLVELIMDETNRKVYGKKAYLERTYLRIDTSHIRAVDIKDVANALDVLVRSGAYCVDDCLMALGMEPLNTDWSTMRWMTRNYMPIEEAAQGGDGG